MYLCYRGQNTWVKVMDMKKFQLRNTGCASLFCSETHSSRTACHPISWKWYVTKEVYWLFLAHACIHDFKNWGSLALKSAYKLNLARISSNPTTWFVLLIDKRLRRFHLHGLPSHCFFNQLHRTELAFNCLKILESRFKNSPDLSKIKLEQLVRLIHSLKVLLKTIK